MTDLMKMLFNADFILSLCETSIEDGQIQSALSIDWVGLNTNKVKLTIQGRFRPPIRPEMDVVYTRTADRITVEVNGFHLGMRKDSVDGSHLGMWEDSVEYQKFWAMLYTYILRKRQEKEQFFGNHLLEYLNKRKDEIQSVEKPGADTK